ncbi:NAD(P)-dependent dehydrogenase (short-subunit alcohol dehydrogenase family) [Rhodothalassium salexigens DSM 2132]|uniref:NAD(P)-dependent dehydrogenase (Short-subunit alcohol dehydrogenase family) n=1 Tax=Rhodothalassium salexigens DSM 2132 TaxID=1188247 RepID=A0A4R2PVA7_RHOSA|nr:SDR family oxidoreductase [Rhodothalassium salexigens]MBB4209950.1 NAD(P)-dependent dehydrogenase (short-subunit alcohol dehydrogenase family) [Rhodothalassium salexigens DSM 2132]MBK1637678.1 short-chain dehydrogenase [Rhodothalassium salexigens DSM 2132]TCP38115.1 NAD(P)-dependent dehydrogenase (short-subunit alcohol dehydrogenase family) [Rhodothalassium salexigens DSM 2132]
MTADLFSLKDKVAIITGSSRGIGRAVAERMAEAGARVVISSRKGEACAAVADAIRAQGGEAAAIPCNIAEDAALEALVAQTHDVFGPVDILVCNAAANPVYGPMTDVDDAAFDKVLHNNVKQNVKLAHLCLPDMAATGDGAVIIVSSIAGYSGSKSLGVYAISKAADFQIARNLAVEWSPKGIRANCIAPGLIKTDFARALWENPKALSYVEHLTPLGRMGEPDDIAGVAVFLASPAARYISGQTITVDGGMTIGDPF